MIAAGKFMARAVTPLAFIKSPEKGTPGVELTFQLKEGPDKDSTIPWIGWLTDSTAERTEESLTHCGYDGEKPDSVMSRYVQLVIEHEEFTRKDGAVDRRARVAWVNDASGAGRFIPMNAAEQATAMSRLKAAMAARKAKAGGAANSAKPEDEVKF